MKTYKLLKLYPSLPLNWEAGMIMEEYAYSSIGSYVPQEDKYTNKALRKVTIETNPEYWEEVIQAAVVTGKLVLGGRRITLKTIDSTFSDIKMNLENDVLTILVSPLEPTPEIVKPKNNIFPFSTYNYSDVDAPPLSKEPSSGMEQFSKRIESNNPRLAKFREKMEAAKAKKESDAQKAHYEITNITPENAAEIKAALKNHETYWVGGYDAWTTGWWSEARQEMFVDGYNMNISSYKRIVLKPIQKPD